MLRHYWTSAWRALRRSSLFAALSIIGMAVGLGVASLCALIVRGEYSYDHFLRGYDNTYLCLSVLLPSGQPPAYDIHTNSGLAGLLRLRSLDVQGATRLEEDTVELGNGATHSLERVYWADPNALDVLQLPIRVGDRALALSQPDSVALTSSAAARIFGSGNVLGRYVLLDGSHRLRVTAILEDLPSHHTQLDSGIFIAGISAYSKLATLDAAAAAQSAVRRGFSVDVLTYLNLTPGASIRPVQQLMPSLMDSLWPRRPPGLGASVKPIRVDQVHLFPGLNPGMQERVKLVSLIGTMVLLVACINFVNLCVSQSGRRAVEVGIRKVAGASRAMLVVQFIGESALLLMLAAGLAIALVELSLPAVNSFLDTMAQFDYWHDPRLLVILIGSALLIAVVAGFYPALVLASMRPAKAVRGLTAYSSRIAAARQTLIAAQFAVLCGLFLAAAVLYQQRDYATRDALESAAAQMLLIRSPCRSALVIELRRLGGVRGAACSGTALLDGKMFENLALKTGGSLAINIVPVEPGLLELYGVHPVAGTFDFSPRAAGGTSIEQPSNAVASIVPRMVINELAMRRLGFANAGAAVGEPLEASRFGPGAPVTGRIVGVAPDFTLNLLEPQLKPTIYIAAPQLDSLISVRLDAAQASETLAQLPRLWAATGASGSIDWFFAREYFRDLYAKIQREDELLGMFSGITLLLAAMGLFALAATLAEQRTVEIGVRKAMGANSTQILRLLVLHFSKPVLYGSLVAWPVAGWLMLRWLHGFAYHTNLQLWLFPLATVLALILAWMAVLTHAMRLSRAPPVWALRYE